MILRDPVHGLISFESDEGAIVEALLQTAEVQRLRRISQLGLAANAYPGAYHTRFAHAVGAAHVMTLFLRRMRELHDVLPFWQRVTTERAREAMAAAFLHDVGHGPFSHLFEEALPGCPKHEEWTARILLDPSTETHQTLSRVDSTLPRRVVELVQGRHEITFLARAVSGLFDVDRCDYLLRDAHATGVSYGAFDLDWLMRSLSLGIAQTPSQAPPLAVDGAKGIPAIESFILARLFMFQQVYFHKTGRSGEWMLSRILGRVGELLNDGARLPAVPTALSEMATTGNANLGDYLELDDTQLWVSLAAWQKTKDSVLSDLSRRLYRRELFKTYELYGEQAEARDLVLARAREVAVEAKLDPMVYVGLDSASFAPFDDSDEPLMVVFPGDVTRRPAEVSFLLARLRGERLERVRLIFAPELRDQVLSAVEV